MAAMETNPTPLCIVCGGKHWTLVREGMDLCRPNHRKLFRIETCTSCGMVSQQPIPSNEELQAAYSVSGDYVCYRPAWKELGWPVWKMLRHWTTRRRVARLTRYAPKRELLEVGCGAGDFMVAAHRAGWQVHAVEYNEEMVEALHREFGFDVRLGNLAPGLWTQGRFDVAVFWNVLEHLQFPLEELSTASDYLRSGGVILLNIPSREAAETGKWFGQYWGLLDLPRHIHFFDRSTLEKLCEKAGLKLACYKTPFVQSAWCYYISCWNWASRDKNRLLSWIKFGALSALITLIMPYIAAKCFASRGLEAFVVLVKS